MGPKTSLGYISLTAGNNCSKQFKTLPFGSKLFFYNSMGLFRKYSQKILMYLLFSIELFITKKMMNQLLFMFVSQNVEFVKFAFHCSLPGCTRL